MTTRNPTRSLVPILDHLPIRKPLIPALPVVMSRQTALHHTLVVEIVARRTRGIITNQQDTAHLHHATAILALDAAPVRHPIATRRLDRPSRPRTPVVDAVQNTLHNLMLQIPIL